MNVTTRGAIAAIATSFTRPANTTAYTQYDLVANATSGAVAFEFTNVVELPGDGFRWEGAALRSINPLAKGKTFRLHLFRTQPTLAANDNEVFNTSGTQTLAVANIAGYLGYVDITLTEAGTTGAAGQGWRSNARNAVPSGGTSLWGVLEQRDSAGYTPLSAEEFYPTLLGLRA